MQVRAFVFSIHVYFLIFFFWFRFQINIDLLYTVLIETFLFWADFIYYSFFPAIYLFRLFELSKFYFQFFLLFDCLLKTFFFFWRNVDSIRFDSAVQFLIFDLKTLFLQSLPTIASHPIPRSFSCLHHFCVHWILKKLVTNQSMARPIHISIKLYREKAVCICELLLRPIIDKHHRTTTWKSSIFIFTCTFIGQFLTLT